MNLTRIIRLAKWNKQYRMIKMQKNKRLQMAKRINKRIKTPNITSVTISVKMKCSGMARNFHKMIQLCKILLQPYP